MQENDKLGELTCLWLAERFIWSMMAIQSCGGARDCSGPDSCSFRQYKVRVWRGMPAARQLPMYMASLPSCSARCAAALFGCASASGSSAPICVMYLCRAVSLVRDITTWTSQQIAEEEGHAVS